MLRFIAAVFAAWLVFMGLIFSGPYLPLPAAIAGALPFSLPLAAFLFVTVSWRRVVR
jgi:hypothetical protein